MRCQCSYFITGAFKTLQVNVIQMLEALTLGWLHVVVFYYLVVPAQIWRHNSVLKSDSPHANGYEKLLRTQQHNRISAIRIVDHSIEEEFFVSYFVTFVFYNIICPRLLWLTLTLRSVLWEEILTAMDSMLWGSKLSPSDGDDLSGADSDAYITGSSQWGRVLQGRLTLQSGASPSTVPEKFRNKEKIKPWI